MNATPDLDGSDVLSVYEDGDGAIWITTGGKGLKRYDKGKITTYTAKDGIFDDAIWTILEDNHGNLWMSTDHGLSSVNRHELERVRCWTR